MGDGCIQGKEANRMPGVKKLHQELENSANGAYFFGHCFSAIRLLLGTSRKKGTKVVLAEMFQCRAATLQYATVSV